MVDYDIYWWLGLTAVCGLILTVTIYFLMASKFRHNVRIKELAKGRKIIIDEKARDYKDKDGNKWWRLKKEGDKEKRLIPIPPPTAIEINAKGKKCVECYRTETGEIIYLEDNTTDPKNDLKDLKPLTTKQRSILITNIKRAEQRKGKSWTENIPMIVGIGAIVMLLVALMIFWGDIAKPALDGRAMAVTITENQKITVQILEDIKRGVQRIEGVEETPPYDEGPPN